MAHCKPWGGPKVKTMRIKELSDRSGVSLDAIRHYEKAGLLRTPARSDNGYRRYTDSDVERLQFIRNCRALDMRLAEVRELLDVLDRPRADCSSVDALVAGHLDEVRAQIASLRDLQRGLIDLQRECSDAGPSEHCGIVRSLSGSGSAKSGRGVGNR